MSVLFCNNNSMSAITSTPSGVGGGSMAVISTQTASGSSAISFTSGIDSTYKNIYLNLLTYTQQVIMLHFKQGLEMVVQIMMLLKQLHFLEHIIMKVEIILQLQNTQQLKIQHKAQIFKIYQKELEMIMINLVQDFYTYLIHQIRHL